MNEPLKCLNEGDTKPSCEGPVEYRMALSPTGKSFPRCEAHWEYALGQYEKFAEAGYASSVAPEWFDESYAGERWDDEY